MESSWRRNVPDKGLALMGITLLARSHEVEGWWLSDRFNPLVQAYDNFADNGDDRGYVRIGGWIPVAGYPHFPYGARVDPDV
jgi:hypothetical protein